MQRSRSIAPGSSTFIRQLRNFIARQRSDWTVTSLSIRALPHETISAYIDRIQRLIDGCQGSSQTLVCCIHGFSGLGKDYARDLGIILRTRLENSHTAPMASSKEFRLVAVGSFPLYLLRFGPADMSILNTAEQVDIPEFTVADIVELLNHVAPDSWTKQDAEALWQAGGGHPYLTKLILCRFYEASAESFQVAAHGVVNDKSFYLTPMIAQATANPKSRDLLEKTIMSSKGIKFHFHKLECFKHRLYFQGLFRQSDSKILKSPLYILCPALQALIQDDLADA